MKKWRCTICKYEVTGDNPPLKCPVCGASQDKFELIEKIVKEENTYATDKRTNQIPNSVSEETELSLDDYLSEYSRNEYEGEEKFSLIQKMAKTGKSEISPMGTRHTFQDLQTILFRGAQFFRTPLDEKESVSTKTIIGATAAQPLELDLPYYVSHMSFGALSKEAKIALAMGASEVGTAACSGEGGMHPEERKHATRYIYEIGTTSFTRDENILRQADAVEIKFGQAAKPGMGGHLPGSKVTEEIAAIRGIKPGEDFISPNTQPDIHNSEDLKKLVDHVREVIEGKPVGIKFSAGHIEEDLKFVLAAEPDFITIDCRGGATGAAPEFIRDNVCLPSIYAIRRARKYLDSVGSKVTFCITGGFRDSTDIAKALALGVDAVALATSSLLAIGCQQYRICNTGKCPVGIATQDPKMRARFSIPASKQRFVNFYNTTRDELETLARINGRSNVHDLDLSDIFTVCSDIADNTDIVFA